MSKVKTVIANQVKNI